MTWERSVIISRSISCEKHTIGSVIRSSWVRASPRSAWAGSKKCRMKVRTALGSEVGRKGSSRNGRSRAVSQGKLAQFRYTRGAGSRQGEPGQMHVLPRSLISFVQRLIRSWTSSGSIVLRVHASSHFGFAGIWSVSWLRLEFFLDLLLGPSPRPLRMERKLGMVEECWMYRGSEAQLCGF
jgi:hypothetical protein